jgi:N-acetylneuraminate lyase
MNATPIRGLVPATYTPMKDDGSLLPEAIADYVAFLRERMKVDALFICGTTGEGYNLTGEERRVVAEAFLRATGDLPVIVHVGHTSSREAAELAAHAADHGATAVAAGAPSYVKPGTVEQLVDFCVEVAAGAPSLPFYFYHIPSLTGVSLPVTDFLLEGGKRIPTLAGVKYTFEDLMEYRACLTLEDGRFDILFGRDQMLLPGLAMGARGAVGTTYNFAAPLYRALWDAFDRHDLEEARALQDRINAGIAICIRYGCPAAMKACMALAGVECGPSRPPLPRFDADARRRMAEELAAVGFLEPVASGA